MRTVQEIYDSLVQEANNDTQLQALTFEPSSLERALFWAVASVLFVHELFWSLFRKEVEDLIDNQKVHTKKWYENLAKDFQLGHDLILVDDKFKYLNIDEEAKIIKHCAVVHVGEELRFKVATNDGLGNTIPCTTAQMTALNAYLQELKDAGVFVFVTSSVGDNIKISLDVYFDPLVLSSEGNLLVDGTPIVSQRIEDWIESIQFNGRFIPAKFQDMVEDIQGVEFVPQLTIQVALPSQPTYTTLNEAYYVPDSGYFQLQNLEINYIPYV